MARPKVEKQPYVHLGLRFDPDLLPALDAYVADIQKQMGAWDVRIDRGKALRHLVVEGLRHKGYLPLDVATRIDTGEGPSVAPVDTESGPVEAPVPLGEAQIPRGQDRGADRLPMSADQFDTKAASSQDTRRTTGRKRPTAAKG